MEKRLLSTLWGGGGLVGDLWGGGGGGWGCGGLLGFLDG